LSCHFLRFFDVLSRNDFQFFPQKLAELQERELAAFKVRKNGNRPLPRCLRLLKKSNEITATVREAGQDDSTEEIEKERQAAQDFIDSAEPLTEEEQAEKESLIKQGFEHWSKRDFQQFIRALESYGWYGISHCC
jgi:SWI/SNF-related matrix-associated actin-dependent regulator of chromatin subfamily A member 5